MDHQWVKEEGKCIHLQIKINGWAECDLHLHLGHLADAFTQSDLQLVHLSE